MSLGLHATPGRTRETMRQAPGPVGRPIVGSLFEMQREGQLPFFVNLWRRYGDTVRLQAGPLVQHLVARPDDVRRVLVTHAKNYCKGVGYKKLKLALGQGLFLSEGPLWQQQRRLMQGPFTSKGVQIFADAMSQCAVEMVDRWEPAIRTGSPLDVNQEMMRLAMDIIARTMFSVKLGEQATEAAQAFRFVLQFVAQRSISIIDWPLFVPIRANRQFRAAMQTLNRFMDQIIAQRRRDPDPPADLLTMLLRARDEATGQGMSDQQVRDEVLTIFFAGHETTAQVLTWTWYLLSQHPEVEARLHAELAQVLGGRLPTAADAPRLSYTRMVIEESMRLYPPILMFVRDAVDEDELGGYPIPGGSMVILSQYITHRHPDYWTEPDRFVPERFDPAVTKDRPNYAYFPFGGGARTCLGDKFAMLETQMVLATVSQRLRMRLVPGHRVEAGFVATLRPKYGLQMTFQRRQG